MKALVVYDSQFGNTEKVAQEIAQILESKASVSIARAAQYGEASWQGVDLLVVGCPTQAWKATKEINAFLERIPKGALAHTAVATFDTLRSACVAHRLRCKSMANKLSKSGARLVTPPESFFVMGSEGPLAEGELAHAAAWSRGLLSELS
jgi:flavodoxin